MSIYPDPPAPRIAYDLDGSIVLLGRSAGADTTPAEVRPKAVRALNSDASPSFGVVGDAAYRGYNSSNSVTWAWNKDADWQLYASIDMQDRNATKNNWVTVFFTEPKQISAVFSQAIAYVFGNDAIYNYAGTVGQPHVVQVSQDTTNGGDGTWTTILNQPAERDSWANLTYSYNGALPGEPATLRWDSTEMGFGSNNGNIFGAPRRGVHRQDGTQQAAGWKPVYGSDTRNVRAIRILCTDWSNPPSQGYNSPVSSTQAVQIKLHVYGTPDTGASDDRLVFQETDGSPKNFDWGDIKQGTTATQTFQIKNLSDDKRARGVRLTMVDANGTTSPAPLDTLDISLDGSSWGRGQFAIPDIAAGQASAPLTLRVQVPETNLLGAWAPRLTIDVEEWV